MQFGYDTKLLVNFELNVKQPLHDSPDMDVP